MVAEVRRALVLAVVAAALAAAPAASGKIVPNRSIAGVPLLASQAKVRAVLGAPASKKVTAGELGTFVDWRYARVTVTFRRGGPVVGLQTRSPRERTATGVGVGSTEAALKRGVANVRCRTQFGFRSCTLGEELPGRRVTVFRMRQGRVASVLVGIVID